MRAKALILECKEAGADAVKFQMWRAKDLYGGKNWEYQLTPTKAIIIKRYCDEIGIEFFCSVFYPEAVSILEREGVKRYKIASRTLKLEDPHSTTTIDAIIKTGKPVIFSDGYCTNFSWPHYKRLYCIPEYPADPKDIDWEELTEYDGFSDHTLGIESALKYAKYCPKNMILEKHVKLKDSKGPDASFSITVQELATLIMRSKS